MFYYLISIFVFSERDNYVDCDIASFYNHLK